MTEAKRQEARKARFLELQARFLHLSPLSAAEVEPADRSPTVPACRLAYAADLRAIERLAMGRTVAASILFNIAHARHLSTGFAEALDTTPAKFDRWAATRGDAPH